jgi:hypothetical protein
VLFCCVLFFSGSVCRCSFGVVCFSGFLVLFVTFPLAMPYNLGGAFNKVCFFKKKKRKMMMDEEDSLGDE